MNGEQLHQEALEIAAQLPFAQPFGPDYEVFKILGKIFLLTAEVNGVKMVNVKCDPYKILEYQELYSFIKLGYHMNKKHWISIVANDLLSYDLLTDLIHDSYTLVVKKLPLKDQKRLKAQ
ncbi:MmcQ/YjbR family DNA-binding protein [Acinetobacter sp. 3657]|uniref:MmcQ/YjbR family DNA-binding protein n=1 Tax=Acinetobacter sp. 3657 TaxID=2817764 RepID=UPI0028672D1B|nr:putative DNA-binding protein (MmcQ/YjbR family) [Prolinoborus sp. 3657]